MTAREQADGAVLLTGATGFVGMELLARLLERTDRRVLALVRARDRAAARERLADTLGRLFGDRRRHAGRVDAVVGDVESPALGLARDERATVAESVTDVLHSAASVSFALPLEPSRAINVDGTRRMLELADEARERGGLRRFAHISTAYVAGTHRGAFGEDDLDVGQGFRNAYERSKFEAERLVRGARERLPVQVFRPSIVVGERETGWTASFNVLYSPLKAFARGAYPALPGRRAAPVDVVPVDYVADAVVALSQGPLADGSGEAFNLVAGRRAATVGRLVDLSARYFGRRPPRLLPPALYRRVVHPAVVASSRGRRRRALRRSEVYFPYFSVGVDYEDARTRARLEPAGIEVTPVEDYFERLADFAVAADWGASSPSRAQVIGAGG